MTEVQGKGGALSWLVIASCVIACLSLGSLLARADEAAAVRQIETLGGRATSANGQADSPIVRVYIPGCKATDGELKVLQELPQMRELSLNGRTGKSPPTSNGRITDAGLRELAGLGLRQLESLDLTGNPITDASLKELRPFEKLKHLDLSMTRITDSGLEHLSALRELETLRIWDVRITDSGLVHLRQLKSLKRLDLAHARVTPEGLATLRSAIPGLKAENKEYGR